MKWWLVVMIHLMTRYLLVCVRPGEWLDLQLCAMTKNGQTFTGADAEPPLRSWTVVLGEADFEAAADLAALLAILRASPSRISQVSSIGRNGGLASVAGGSAI